MINVWVRHVNHMPLQIPLGSSRHFSTRHVRRVERVETSASSRAVRQARHNQNALGRRVERVLSCQDVKWRGKWNLGLCVYVIAVTVSL